MSHVFISYSSEDRHNAITFQKNLEGKGFKVWRDQVGIDPGAEWRKEIDEAVYDAFVIIILISPDSMKSTYVTYEWACAIGMKHKLLPVKIKETDNIHPKLSDFHIEDFTGVGDWDRLFNKLYSLREEGYLVPQNSPSGLRDILSCLNSNADNKHKTVALDYIASFIATYTYDDNFFSVPSSLAKLALTKGVDYELRERSIKLLTLCDELKVPDLVKDLIYDDDYCRIFVKALLESWAIQSIRKRNYAANFLKNILENINDEILFELIMLEIRQEDEKDSQVLYRNEQILDAILFYKDHESEKIQYNVVRSLGFLGDIGYITIIEQIGKDSHYLEVVEEAIEAIKRITNKFIHDFFTKKFSPSKYAEQLMEEKVDGHIKILQEIKLDRRNEKIVVIVEQAVKNVKTTLKKYLRNPKKEEEIHSKKEINENSSDDDLVVAPQKNVDDENYD